MVRHCHSPRQQAQPLINKPASKKRTAATVSGGNSANTCLVEPNAPPQNSGANNINRYIPARFFTNQTLSFRRLSDHHRFQSSIK